MQKIVIDDNGNVIDELEVRNQQIKERLQPFVEQLTAERASNKKAKLGYKIGFLLDDAFRSYGLMPVEKFVEITCEDIEDYWNKFRSIIAHYIVLFDIIVNKQDFCSYMGITISQYDELERSDDEDIKHLMASINDSFIGLAFKAGETGGADVSALKTRLGAKKAGHAVISAKEEMIAEALVSRPSEAMLKEAMQLVGDKPERKRLK